MFESRIYSSSIRVCSVTTTKLIKENLFSKVLEHVVYYRDIVRTVRDRASDLRTVCIKIKVLSRIISKAVGAEYELIVVLLNLPFIVDHGLDRL